MQALQCTRVTSSRATEKLQPSLHVGPCTRCKGYASRAADEEANKQEVLAAGPDGWSIPSNYPELSDGQILRLDWFILFFQFVTVCVVAIVISLGAVPQVHCHPHQLAVHFGVKGCMCVVVSCKTKCTKA